jgi:hypothetical protein
MDPVTETRNGKPYIHWNKEAVMLVAGQYDSMVNFKNDYVGAYRHARRRGFLDEVNDLVTGERCVETLLNMVTRALSECARRFSLARRMRNIGDQKFERCATEVAPLGNYLDHDISHWDQSAEEVEELALNYIERINQFGNDEDIRLAWDMFYTHQLHGRDGKRSRALTTVPQQGKGDSYA